MGEVERPGIDEATATDLLGDHQVEPRAAPAAVEIARARCFADRGVVERVDLADLRPAQRMRGPARAYKADDSPAGVPERARRCITEPPAGAENEHARAHQAGSSNGLTSIGVLRTPT